MLFDTVLSDEVALLVLSHIEDPCDLLRVGQTCHRALRLSRDKHLWEVVLRRSPHERARRWCSMVVGGVPHLTCVSVSGEDVGIMEWLRFFARHKRALIARLRPHLDSEPLAKALAELLLSRELVIDWLANLPSGVHDVCTALVALAPDYVYHLVIFPLLEAHLSYATVARQAGSMIPADAVFSRSNRAAIKLPVVWLHHHLHATLVDKFVPLFTSRLFEGEMELDPARATDPNNIEANRERLQKACNAILEMCESLQLSTECRLIWSHLRSCTRRLHRVTPTQASADSSGQGADRERDREKEKAKEEQVSTLAMGMTFIMRTAFPMLSNHAGIKRLSVRQQRNLILTSKMIQLLVVHRPSGSDQAPQPIKEVHWQCMSDWLQAKRPSIDRLLTQFSAVSDDEMEELLKKTVLTPAAESKPRPAKPAEGEAAEVGALEKHLRAYALERLKSDGHLQLDGAGQHPRWVLQRLYYLFAYVQFTIKVEAIAGSFKHVELRPKGRSKPLTMTRLEQHAPGGGDGVYDVWQSEVSSTSLGLMEDVIAGRGAHGGSEQAILGYVFRIGLFSKPPAIDKHVSTGLRADPRLMMAVAAVPTHAITSNLPDGHVELAVPLVATTLQQFRRDGAGARDSNTGPPEQRDAAKNEKRGWFQGLKQKLHRSSSTTISSTSKAVAEEETPGKAEAEKEAEEKDDEEEEEQGERNTLRVVVSFALVHQ